MWRYWIFTFLFFICGLSQVRGSQYLENFDLDIDGNSLLISWTTTEGFSCEDLTIQYSTDSLVWEEIYRYPGICGSESKAEDYDYLFKNPATNRVIYFKIGLGRFGESEILSTIIRDYSKSALQFVPHPLNIKSVLYIQNNHKSEVVLEVYSLTGELKHELKLGRVDRIHFSDYVSLESGVYIIISRMNGVPTRQLFVVQSSF